MILDRLRCLVFSRRHEALRDEDRRRLILEIQALTALLVQGQHEDVLPTLRRLRSQMDASHWQCPCARAERGEET